MNSERRILFAWVVLLLAVSVWPAPQQTLPSSGPTLPPPASLRGEPPHSVTIPFALDHNRILVDAELQQTDGGWRKARLWVDTGNPEFMISERFARELGIVLPAAGQSTDGRPKPFEVQPPHGLRIGGMALNVQGVQTTVRVGMRHWSTLRSDANLPSTVLRRYQVVFDYPRRQLTIAEPGSLPHRGVRVPASVHPQTGIVQIDAVIGGERFSFALDNGASYSFISDDALARLAREHPDWPRFTGATGCANIWGWWPEEAVWPVIRIPEIRWGPVRLADVGMAGLPKMFPNGSGLGAWYSQKTARPVDGFLGPNAFMAFRVESDFTGGAVYFERGGKSNPHDMDLVGLTLCQEEDGFYRVIGVAKKKGLPVVEGVEPGDKLLRVGDLTVGGATMGTVVDALRGKPGENRILLLERNGKTVTTRARVRRLW